jgi:hypothetical protein
VLVRDRTITHPIVRCRDRSGRRGTVKHVGVPFLIVSRRIVPSRWGAERGRNATIGRNVRFLNHAFNRVENIVEFERHH